MNSSDCDSLLDVCLRINGFALTAPKTDVVKTIVSLAFGAPGDDELAAWVRDNTKEL